MGSVHQKTELLLPWYVNGSLPERERAAVEAHLRDCLPCRAALREEQRIQDLVRSQEPIPTSAAHGVADLLRAIDRPRSAARFVQRRPALAFGAAAVLIAGMLSFVWLDRAGVERPGESFLSQTSGGNTAPNRIDIVFAAGVGKAAVDEVIAGIDGRVVAGPSAIGRYTVDVPAASPDELAQILAGLSKDPRVQFAGKNFTGAPSPENGAASPRENP